MCVSTVSNASLGVQVLFFFFFIAQIEMLIIGLQVA